MMYESKPAASAIPEKTDIAIHFPDVYFRIKSSGISGLVDYQEKNKHRIKRRKSNEDTYKNNLPLAMITWLAI